MDKKWRGLVALLGVLALVAGACGDDDDGGGAGAGDSTEQSDGEASGAATATITALDDGNGGGYGYEVPQGLAAGLTELTLSNTGAEAHHAQLFKLNDGATVEELGAALATGNPAAALEVGAFDGGTATVDPGGTSSANAVVELEEGTYVFMCFIENAQGPHVAQGMVTPFQVAAAAEPSGAELEGDATVNLIDFGFEIEGDIAAGSTLEVVNTSGSQPHEMAVARLAEDGTQQDVLDFFQAEGGPGGPPSFASVGGVQALLPGADQGVSLQLEPGSYVLFCAIPDFTDPEQTPHFAKGMITTITVS